MDLGQKRKAWHVCVHCFTKSPLKANLLYHNISMILYIMINNYYYESLCRSTGQVQVNHFTIDYKYTPFSFSRVKRYSTNSLGLLAWKLFHGIDFLTIYSADSDCSVYVVVHCTIRILLFYFWLVPARSATVTFNVDDLYQYIMLRGPQYACVWILTAQLADTDNLISFECMSNFPSIQLAPFAYLIQFLALARTTDCGSRELRSWRRWTE